MELKFELPKDLEYVANKLDKKELNGIIKTALKEKLSEAFLFKIADELLKNSKMTDELALKLGSELKQRAYKSG